MNYYMLSVPKDTKEEDISSFLEKYEFNLDRFLSNVEYPEGEKAMYKVSGPRNKIKEISSEAVKYNYNIWANPQIGGAGGFGTFGPIQ